VLDVAALELTRRRTLSVAEVVVTVTSMPSETYTVVESTVWTTAELVATPDQDAPSVATRKSRNADTSAIARVHKAMPNLMVSFETECLARRRWKKRLLDPSLFHH
jgi:hypothetical protein